jgi:DNA polymerase-3 subunit alpha
MAFLPFGITVTFEIKFFHVHFPQSLVKYPLRGAGVYLVEGKVILEYGCPSIEVIRCAKMPLKPEIKIF